METTAKNFKICSTQLENTTDAKGEKKKKGKLLRNRKF